MYCYPYPRGSTIPPLRVPYLAGPRYRLTGADNFTEFIAEASQKIDSNQLQFTDEEEALFTLLQSWLFFGLASEALGRDVDPKEFVEKDTAGEYINPSVPKWFWIELHQRWKRLKTARDVNDFDRIKDKLCKHCSSAQIGLAFGELAQKENPSEKYLMVLLSIHMLMSVILDLLPQNTSGIIAHEWLSTTRMLFQRMIDAGWCRKRLNFLKSTRFTYPSLYFLSSVAPLHGRSVDHSQCTDTTCAVATPLLPPLHRKEGCCCTDVSAPMGTVISILENGDIPLVKIRITQNELELDIVPYSKGTPFVAISHLWSDRQFGSTRNSLPACQLRYLHACLKELHPPEGDFALARILWEGWRGHKGIDYGRSRERLFWLDTFCVPQDPKHAHIKAQAINMMNLIYAAADQTLILDASLQDTDMGTDFATNWEIGRPTFLGFSPELLVDATAYICGSNWMGRAWTLQEGVISTNCVFSFSGSLAYIRLLHVLARDPLLHKPFWKHIFDWLFIGERLKSRCSIYPQPEKVRHEPLATNISLEIIGVLKRSLDIGDLSSFYPREPTSRAVAFVNAHRNLQSRTTSMSEDIPLILANLSSLNGNFISKIEKRDDQMRELIYAVGNVPLELLFSHCRKIETRPNEADGWIPYEISPEDLSGDMLLKLGTAGFTFELGDKASDCEFVVSRRHETQPAHFLLSFIDAKTIRKKTYEVRARNEELSRFALKPDASICILIYTSAVETEFRGAQFLITRSEESQVLLRYICPLKLREKTDNDPLDPARPTIEGLLCSLSDASPVAFVLERSTMAENTDLTRPQNPEKFSSRIDVFMSNVFRLIQSYIHSRVYYWLVTFLPTRLVMALMIVVGLLEIFFVQRALERLCHRAWVATYRHSWNPKGPWRWFWYLMNFNSPISMEGFNKFGISLAFAACVQFNQYTGIAMLSLIWGTLYDGNRLVGMYIICFSTKLLQWLFF